MSSRRVRVKTRTDAVGDYQTDLMDIQFTRASSGHKYILTCIDIYSRYLQVVPLKSKNQQAVWVAMQALEFRNARPSGLRIASDAGTEFNLCRRNVTKLEVGHFLPSGSDLVDDPPPSRWITADPQKGKHLTATVESAHRGLWLKLGQSIRKAGDHPRDIIKHLDAVVYERNHTPHSAFENEDVILDPTAPGASPEEDVTPAEMWQHAGTATKYMSLEEAEGIIKLHERIRFEVGDRVRKLNKQGPFTKRSFHSKYTGSEADPTVYEITRQDTGLSWFIRNLTTGRELKRSRAYWELSPVGEPSAAPPEPPGHAFEREVRATRKANATVRKNRELTNDHQHSRFLRTAATTTGPRTRRPTRKAEADE